jgi:predicted nucleic acid-binding protein
MPLDNMDMLIAASAMAAGAALVTHNVKHFSRIKGLKVEDWFPA